MTELLEKRPNAMRGEYYHTKESVEEYIKAAEGHSGLSLIEKLRKFLPSGSSILELGTGPGTDWRILRSDYNVVGSDNSMEFLKHLASKEPDAEFLELDAATILTDKHFDGIYSNKVMHHLSDEDLQKSFQRQAEVLNPGGVVCHSFWRGEGSEHFKGMFVNYHQEEDLASYFGDLFEVLLMELYPEFEPDDSVLLIGRKR